MGGQQKKNGKMTKHHSPKRLDEEGLLLCTPQINESAKSSPRPSRRISAVPMEVKLEKPHTCGNI